MLLLYPSQHQLDGAPAPSPPATGRGPGRTRDVAVAAHRRPALPAVNRGSPSPSRAPVRFGQGDAVRVRTPSPPSRSTDGAPTLDPLSRRADPLVGRGSR